MLSVTAIPAFNDNYIWMMFKNQNAWVVDPGDAVAVLAALQRHGLKLQGVLITHHHPDHTGGLSHLLTQYPELTIYGPNSSHIPSVTHTLAEGNVVDVEGVSFNVLEIPGHTLDHIAYFSDQENLHRPLLFCGDTLFAGGCGRVFEGTYEQMYQSLEKLAALPDETEVYCAHEYTLANLMFANAVEPDNQHVEARLHQTRTLRTDGTITLPTNIGMERLTNPFLRCRQKSVIATALKHGAASVDAEDVFASIRGWKDNF